jgi:hypothetical protein
VTASTLKKSPSVLIAAVCLYFTGEGIGWVEMWPGVADGGYVPFLKTASSGFQGFGAILFALYQGAIPGFPAKPTRSVLPPSNIRQFIDEDEPAKSPPPKGDNWTG